MPCPKCRNDRLIDIVVNIGEHEVTMHSCSRCGTRWWEQEGRPLALPKVLEMAASSR